MADREDREAHGWAPRSRYLTITGDTPQLGPADFDGARAYVGRLEQAISRGGWTDNERTRLHRLHAIWARRAAGRDPRFNAVGNRVGGLASHERDLVGVHVAITKLGQLVDHMARNGIIDRRQSIGTVQDRADRTTRPKRRG